MNKPLYVFLHVPKCAGSTVGHHIAHNAPPGEALPVYLGCPYWNHVECAERYFESRDDIYGYLRSLSDSQKDTLRILYGHDVYYGIHCFFPDRDVRYLTFFRAPEKRMISSYWYRREFALRAPKEPNWEKSAYYRKYWSHVKDMIFLSSEACSFEEWMPHYDGFLTDFLSERSFDDHLRAFYFVGLVDQPADLSFAYRLFGVERLFPDQNISKKKRSIPLAIARTYVERVRPHEVRVFQRGVRRNRMFRALHLWQFLMPRGRTQSLSQVAYRLSARFRRRSLWYGSVVDRIKSYL